MLRKNKRNTTFLTKPSNKRRKIKIKMSTHTRKDISLKAKLKFIDFMHVNDDKTVGQCLNHNTWKNPLRNVKLNTLMKWKSNFKKEGTNYKALKKKELNYGMKKRAKQTISKFPTIEAEVLRMCIQRVENNRDRSMQWMVHATKGLIKDKTRLNALNLTQYERQHIHEFSGSMGFVQKLMKRNSL